VFGIVFSNILQSIPQTLKISGSLFKLALRASVGLFMLKLKDMLKRIAGSNFILGGVSCFSFQTNDLFPMCSEYLGHQWLMPLFVF